MDAYWSEYDRCLDRVAICHTVEAVIDTLNEFYGASAGDAFHPGGADRDLLGVLVDAGWTVTWAAASYYYRLRDPHGGKLEFVEGDVYKL